MELRDYQLKSINSIQNDFKNGKKRTLLILPTGCGKTVVFAYVAKQAIESGQKVLILAHRQELILQAKAKLEHIAEIHVGVEKAESRALYGTQCVVASVQTLKGRRLREYDKDYFDLIIIDEAHHSSAKTYKDIVEYFNANVLGVTATPDRSDEKQLGDIFESIAFQYPLITAIKEDYLANIKGFMIDDFTIDLGDLKVKTGKDFSNSDLEEILLKYIDPIAQGICNPTIKDLKSVVFLPSVKSCELLTKALNYKGIKAEYISGETESRQRANTLDKFTKGKITHLVNCSVLTEGYDEPSIQNIIIARPTKSRALYAQMVGRGTRKHKDKLRDEKDREFVYLTEFVFTNTKHKLVDAYELFSSKGFDERVRQKAKEKSKGNFLDELEDAHDILFNKDRIYERLQSLTKSGYEYDPFAICDFFGVDLSGEFEVRYEGRVLEGAITDRQIELLGRHGILNPQTLTKAQASKIISIIAENGWSVTNIKNKIKEKIYSETR